MRFTKLATIAAASAVLIVGIPATAASAATSAVGGGLWDHGVNSKVYSKYHHASKYHSATACNGGLLNQCAKSVAAKNKWASASLPRNLGGGNTAFWNTY
ncbi:lactococcin 972 family bacteriocin [Curtobacterium sp. APC 4022]|uniref:lactococcin 972 family bacteriocin n=1 Tax=Curtobacterium sp. APC 4022 TaxID=3035201 RepID=UPI0025B4B401|nr:lactococcin 972 family bacteriocin [Curtobacterium sp. APC 4022]MDN3478801.1 lactococcin 972 family bacteriocin [Curtobacterium sp. APC 4022]